MDGCGHLHNYLFCNYKVNSQGEMPILDEIGESAEATTERESSSKEGDSMGMATPKPTTVILVSCVLLLFFKVFLVV